MGSEERRAHRVRLSARMARRADDERSLGEVHGRQGMGGYKEGDRREARQAGRGDSGSNLEPHALLAAEETYRPGVILSATASATAWPSSASDRSARRPSWCSAPTESVR